MLIREYTERDLDDLRAIHSAQGFEYMLPDLRNPLFITKLILADEPVAKGESASPAAFSVNGEGASKTPNPCSAANSRILGAALLRLTAEAYLLLDPSAGTPRERWQWLLALHEAARRDAWQRGLEDAHAWLPPPIAQKFGRRLERLGWRRDDAWTPYCTRLVGK